MTPEEKFKLVVEELHSNGIYPGPTAIKRALGFTGKMNNLNGQQCKWRREVMYDLNIPLKRPDSVHMHEIVYGDPEPAGYYY